MNTSIGIDALSNGAFIALSLVVFAAWVGLHSWRGFRPRLFALGLAWLALPLLLATSGALQALIGTPWVAAYLLLCNGAAVALALSRYGQDVIDAVPIEFLIAFQAFRLPLELLLHHWFDIGVVPIQMTYEGLNFDITTGVLALLVPVAMRVSPARARWGWALGFNLIGSVLLLSVMVIAVQSVPSPLRSFMDEPALLLPFYAPQTWIVSVCVVGALWAHVVSFRWLAAEWRGRRQSSSSDSDGIPR
ncbi:MAG: hypothetical protein AAFU77_06625 [Myxococcota bacterium]